MLVKCFGLSRLFCLWGWIYGIPLAEGPGTGYVWSMTLEAIKEAIERLPPEQQTVLASWLSERDWNAWDDEGPRVCNISVRGIERQ